MKRTIHSHSVSDIDVLKSKLLHWAQQYDEVVWLDSNEYEHQNYPQYQAILAVDAFTSLKTDYTNAFDQLEEYQNGLNDWIFGYLSYDLKNDTERLASKNDDRLHFADLHFFQPKRLFLIQNNTLEMHYLSMVDDELTEDYEDILNQSEFSSTRHAADLQINSKIHKEAYIEKVSDLLAHIGRGDIYEANFCQEFFASGFIDPVDTYKKT